MGYLIETCGNCVQYMNGKCRMLPNKNVHPNKRKCIWYGSVSTMRALSSWRGKYCPYCGAKVDGGESK